MTTERTTMIKKNFQAFLEKLPSLIQETGKGRYAVMCEGELIETLSSAEDAHKFAFAKFNDDNYSVHEIDDEPVDFGYYSTNLAHGALY